jgi:hypothetical protein
MDKNGCRYNGGSCHPILDKCEGCQKAKEFPAGKFCLIFPDPSIKWRAGRCNMATHVKIETAKPVEKINPLKASKRGAHK